MLVPEAGAIYVMDRGYIDFGRLCGLHQAGAFFVTRAKTNLHAHRVYSASTDRTGGVIADQTIALDGTRSRQDYPVHLRRIRFKAPETGTTLVFLKTQIWIAASVYVLVAIARKRLNIEASLYTLMQVFSVAIFEKVAIKTAFLPGAYGSEGDIGNRSKSVDTAARQAGRNLPLT
jgi:hypothetical protein